MIENSKNGARKGQALIMAIVFLLALTFLGIGLIMMASLDIRSARNLRMAEEALNAAEEGAMVGMAYASNPASGFLGLGLGQTFEIASYDPNMPNDGQHFSLGYSSKNMQHFVVEVGMGGNAPSPPGSPVGESGSGTIVVHRMVEVRSTGYVLDSAGDNFDPDNPPVTQRTIEILARIQFQL